MKQIIRVTTSLVLAISLLVNTIQPVVAKDTLGIHILSPHDLDEAQQLLSVKENEDDWKYLTVPLTLNDLDDVTLWQRFFDEAKSHKMIPIVRLATRVENGGWIKPNRWQIVRMINFLNLLDWPTEDRYIIVFNEVNHAKEWGNDINPEEYAQILEFTSRWARTEPHNYQVLPAAMDLAAPNSQETMEAFTFLERMYQTNPKIFEFIDIWNSHSYPNPGFSSPPTLNTKNSMRGFLHELDYLKRKTGRDYQVMITETGWTVNKSTAPWLKNYYLYALQHIWSDPQVIAVTPFVAKGAPGPFANFSFYTAEGEPTVHYEALQEALKIWHQQNLDQK